MFLFFRATWNLSIFGKAGLKKKTGGYRME